MSGIGWILAVAGWSWLALIGLFVYADAKLRRDHDERLDIRDWQEKVAAMRRLQDEEGDA